MTDQGLKNSDVNADGKVDAIDKDLLGGFITGIYIGTLPNNPING